MQSHAVDLKWALDSAFLISSHLMWIWPVQEPLSSKAIMQTVWSRNPENLDSDLGLPLK